MNYDYTPNKRVCKMTKIIVKANNKQIQIGK